MKRVYAALLALAMALTCVGQAALAAEDSSVDYGALESEIESLYGQVNALYEQLEPMEEQLRARYADYYELYGAIEDWDEEMWELADGWSQYEWDAYLSGEEASWGGWDDGGYLAGVKKAMGMYFPEGINVRVNGKYLDTAPIARDGVTYLPADALLAALGMDAVDMEAVELDGTACLPIRAVAEANGYEVDWDEWYEVVEVDNWELLAAEIDQEFTVLNTILKAAMNTVDPEKTYSTKGSVTYSAALYGDEKDDTASMTVDMEGLVKGDYSALSAGYAIRTDLTDLEDLIVQFGGQEAMDVVKALNGSMDLRVDGKTGGIYFKSDLWSKFGANQLPDGKWIGMEDEGFASDYTEIMSQMREMTVGSVLVMAFRNSWQPYESLDGVRTVMKLLVGDDLFTTAKSGSTTTYTCKMDMVKLITRAAALGVFSAGDIGELFGDAGIPSADYQITAKVNGEKLTALSAKGNLKWSVLSLEFDMNSTATQSDLYLALKGRYIGKIEMSGTSQTAVSTQPVPGAPAGFLDYEALMEDYYQSLYGQW